MSFRRALWALAVAVCLAAPVAVQAQGDYLDVFMVKVKPEKTADFLTLPENTPMPTAALMATVARFASPLW